MAVTQISKIQVRRGRREDLPSLSAGEMGWAVDTQQLFIGNGTFEDGALAEGNTEILTEKSQLGQLSSFTTEHLNNDESTPIAFYSVQVANWSAGILKYIITRGPGLYASPSQSGQVKFAYDGSTSIDVDISEVGDVGVVISASLSGNTISFNYTSNDVGFDASIDFVLSRF